MEYIQDLAMQPAPAQPTRGNALQTFFETHGRRAEVPSRQPLGGEIRRRAVCQLEQGWVTRHRRSTKDHRSIVDIKLPGDYFNFSALSGHADGDELQFSTRSAFRWVDADGLQREIERDRELALEVIRHLSDRDGRLGEALAQIGRLAAFDAALVLIARIRQALVARGMLRPGSGRMPFPISQIEFGSIIGITPVHANRVVRSLREENLLTMRARTIWFDDLDAFNRRVAELVEN